MKTQPPICKHEQTVWDDDVLFCLDCGAGIAITCQRCGGGCFVFEDDYYMDWINCGHDLITCPTCQGTGVDREKNTTE